MWCSGIERPAGCMAPSLRLRERAISRSDIEIATARYEPNLF